MLACQIEHRLTVRETSCRSGRHGVEISGIEFSAKALRYPVCRDGLNLDNACNVEFCRRGVSPTLFLPKRVNDNQTDGSNLLKEASDAHNTLLCTECWCSGPGRNNVKNSWNRHGPQS